MFIYWCVWHVDVSNVMLPRVRPWHASGNAYTHVSTMTRGSWCYKRAFKKQPFFSLKYVNLGQKVKVKTWGKKCSYQRSSKTSAFLFKFLFSLGASELPFVCGAPENLTKSIFYFCLVSSNRFLFTFVAFGLHYNWHLFMLLQRRILHSHRRR